MKFLQTDSFFPAGRNMKANRRGFTLIELLMVIAVIGILSGVLIVVLGQGRVKAQRSQSASNLRQIGAAFILYTNDHGGVLPDVQASGMDERTTWWSQLSPYLGGPEGARWKDFLRNPALRSEYQSEKIAEYSGKAWLQNGPSYGMNAYLGRATVLGTHKGPQLRLSEVMEPSRTLLASEASFNQASPYAGLMPWNNHLVNSASEVVDGNLVYAGGAIDGVSHLLWVDGHVSSSDDVKQYATSPYLPGQSKDVWRPKR